MDILEKFVNKFIGIEPKRPAAKEKEHVLFPSQEELKLEYEAETTRREGLKKNKYVLLPSKEEVELEYQAEKARENHLEERYKPAFDVYPKDLNIVEMTAMAMAPNSFPKLTGSAIEDYLGMAHVFRILKERMFKGIEGEFFRPNGTFAMSDLDCSGEIRRLQSQRKKRVFSIFVLAANVSVCALAKAKIYHLAGYRATAVKCAAVLMVYLMTHLAYKRLLKPNEKELRFSPC